MLSSNNDLNRDMSSSEESLWVVPDIGVNWKHILASTTVREYSRGNIIYMANQPSSHLFYLQEGLVKIAIMDAEGAEKILAIHEPRSLFGESAAIDGGRYFATATAMEDSLVRLIPVEQLPCIIEKNPQVSLQMMSSLVKKMRLLALQISFLSFSRVPQRLAQVLCGLAGSVGVFVDEGIRLNVKLRHYELASLIGASRVTVTNTLNDFKRQGLIDTDSGQIVITNLQRLKDLIK